MVSFRLDIKWVWMRVVIGVITVRVRVLRRVPWSERNVGCCEREERRR